MAESGNNKDVANYKLERAKDDFESAQLLLKSGKLKAANNRAYYSCFHAVDAVLALEPIAFKKHKDTLAYFNKNYIHTEKFPNDIGRQISRLEVIRHKSDYDDFYIASKSETEEQVMTAGNVIKLVEDYLNINKEVSE
jgi:uncharacterized protein (UPF0332 family)